MDNNGSSVFNGALGAVDLLKEPEDTTRLVGNAVVRPAQVLIVPYIPQGIFLQGTKTRDGVIYMYIKKKDHF